MCSFLLVAVAVVEHQAPFPLAEVVLVVYCQARYIYLEIQLFLLVAEVLADRVVQHITVRGHQVLLALTYL
jgi:hypothetical protein